MLGDNRYKVQGEQTNRGLELSAAGALSPRLSVYAGLALLSAQVDNTGNPATSGKQALGLARRLSLKDLPDTRRAQTAPGTLTVCQWVRAFMDDRTRLFLMIDPLRKAPGAAIQSLASECRTRRQQGAAFFWVLPLEAACHAEALEIDTILEPLKNLKPADET